MHFEASQEAIVEWGCSGAYSSTGFTASRNRVGSVQCPADGSTAAVDQAIDTQEDTEIAQADNYSGEDDDATGASDDPASGGTQYADNTQHTTPDGIETQFDDGTPHVPQTQPGGGGESPTNGGVETTFGL